MKKIYTRLFSLIVLLVLGSCTDNYELEVGFDAPESLISPTANQLLAIDLENGSPTVFEWTKATSYYGGVVLYEVVFDKENGNFSSPIYKVVSNGGGSDNWLSLTPKQLIILAKNANIGIDSEGIVKMESGGFSGRREKRHTRNPHFKIKAPGRNCRNSN